MFGIPIHKLIVHFPIALAFIALAYDSWALYTRNKELHRASHGLTLWAAAGALAAAVTGLQLAQSIRIDRAAVTGHAAFAIVSTVLLTVLGGVRYSARAREREHYATWWWILELAVTGLVFAAAITGHRL